MSCVRAVWFIILAVVLWRPSAAGAQTDPPRSASVVVGFAVPMDANTDRVGEVTGGFIAPAIWGATTSFLRHTLRVTTTK